MAWLGMATKFRPTVPEGIINLLLNEMITTFQFDGLINEIICTLTAEVHFCMKVRFACFENPALETSNVHHTNEAV